MRERGSALLIAVVSVTVLLLISGIFFSLVSDQMKSNSYEEKAIKSYYLAQAGVFYGIAKIRATTVPTPDATTGISTQSPINNPFGYGGQFSVKWQKSVDGLYYTITGNGSYGSGTGQVDRSLQAYYKIGTTGGAPGEIVGQTVLNYDKNGHEILGQGQTMFVFSNSPPPVSTWPIVKLYQPLYIYTVNNGDHTREGNSLASSVLISLRKSSDLSITIQPTYTNLTDPNPNDSDFKYTVHDFQGVTGPITFTYTGTESVKLVIEGLITTGLGGDPLNWGTGTVNNNFLVTPYEGLIWQVEQ